MEISKETLKNADFNNETGEEAVKISITLKLISQDNFVFFDNGLLQLLDFLFERYQFYMV